MHHMLFIADRPFRRFTSLLLVILLAGFSIPVPAKAAPEGQAPRPGSGSSSDSPLLIAIHNRLLLAAKMALSRLNPPSELSRLSSQFEEPLVATSSTSGKEDRALLQSLRTFRDRTVEDDLSALNGFLSEHPYSVWRVALLTDLGLLNYHYGYFSRAISDWEEAWEEGRNVTTPNAKPLVDRAVGELARMHARLGHVDRLEALFKELGDRPISGPATEAITNAREGLAVMHNEPGIAYLCGPMALKNLLLSEGLSYDKVRFLDEVRSGPHGVTLDQVSQLATRAGFAHRVVFRSPGQPIPIPSVIHWKVSHFAAIVGQEGTRLHIIDPTFGTDLWISKAAVDTESDGYFLIPDGGQALAWREASKSEIAQVRGMGYPATVETGATTPSDCECQKTSKLMATYGFHEMVVSVHIVDTPVGYAPPKGPPVEVTLTYNQREAFQPATFSYFNVSQKWTLNWLSYIQDDPPVAGALVSRYVAGGGDINYAGYNGSTGKFAPDPRDASVLSRTTTGPISYTRTLADGSTEIYSASNGATTYPRLIFLSQIIDAQGNSVSLTYDTQQRLTAITDATGRMTTFSYGITAHPLLVTQITDPFGRSAQLAYDSTNRLVQITDILGLTSQFTYDASSLINAMMTPYGTTHFTYSQSGTNRTLTATDPLGHTEEVEWIQPAPAPIPFSEPAALVPVGIINPFNEYITGRDTFYWDKHAYAVGAGDVTKARIHHWMHLNTNTNEMYHALESYKYPLENRVWMNYPNQSSTGFSGSLDSPTRIGRVLDDGNTQLSQFTYNTLGHATDIIDPLGRETQFVYDTNQVDLLQVKQRISASAFSTVAQFTYNTHHLPLTYTDPAGQTTTFAYNTAGQLTQVTDPLGETTTYQYNSLGYLTAIINPNSQTHETLTYDTFGRVATTTDSEGYSVAYAYDAADRITQETFPDGTTHKFTWTNLDLTKMTDRQGNTTEFAYDAVRNLLSATDPLNHVTSLGYYENQSMKSLTDPNGNTTTWNIDIQNRLTGKQFADGSHVTTTYENTTSRTKSITDQLGQIKTFTYSKDDAVTKVTYTNTVNPTSAVNFTYDPFFRRPTSMTDGSGTTTYSYYPPGVLGALQMQSEASPFTNGTITYQYDALSRRVARTVDTNTETFAYDKLSRLITHGTALGSFNLAYLGQTGQMTNSQINSGAVSTAWAYDTNTNDRRLKAINNSGATRSYNYTATPENQFTQIQETAPLGSSWAPKTWNFSYDNAFRLTQASSTAGAYDYGLDAADNLTSSQSPATTASGSYNNLNEAQSFAGNTYTYDKNGNVVDDGVRTYTWDAENRLLSITSKAQPSHVTSFRYDGLGRRIAIDTTTGSLTSETRYLWCGDQLCQARTSADVVSRRYYPEGEYLPLGGTSLYYAQDHLGSVRDVLAAQNGTRVASFDYEPFGNPSQSNGRVSTDFRFAGMFYDQQDGLYLTKYRAYDPKAQRWLGRDPMGEQAGTNLYSYAADDPSNFTDPLGADWQQNLGQWLSDHNSVNWLFNPTLDNGLAGFADEFTMGIATRAYRYYGLGGTFDECSGAFTVGKWLGLAAGLGKAAWNLREVGPKLWKLNWRTLLTTGRFYGGRVGQIAKAEGWGWLKELGHEGAEEVGKELIHLFYESQPQDYESDWEPTTNNPPSNNWGQPGGCGDAWCLMYK
ncbi:MAG TPA: RHS repeat-associated core domain-containing protein [Bryobacteraceae bacterium]|nr:RHS repeat-associated core domain-containing protein [Bryobacteraceae bacterium]